MSVTEPRTAPNRSATCVSGHRKPVGGEDQRLRSHYCRRDRCAPIGLSSEACPEDEHHAGFDRVPGQGVHELDAGKLDLLERIGGGPQLSLKPGLDVVYVPLEHRPHPTVQEWRGQFEQASRLEFHPHHEMGGRGTAPLSP
jgi:hypothetical protein